METWAAFREILQNGEAPRSEEQKIVIPIKPERAREDSYYWKPEREAALEEESTERNCG